MVAPDGAKLHPARPLTVKLRGRQVGFHSCDNRRLTGTAGTLRVTLTQATGMSCSHAELIMRGVARWLDPAQPSDLGALHHQVTYGYSCRIITSPPATWWITCGRGSLSLEAYAAIGKYPSF